jgi:hypothetical protein
VIPIFKDLCIGADDEYLGMVECDCGYLAFAFASPGWDGPTPALPTLCPECGHLLAAHHGPPWKGAADPAGDAVT